MRQRMFIFATDRCFGCGGCVAACAAVNGMAAELGWRELHKLPPPAGDFHTLYLSLACNHCTGAPCVTACPTGALHKRRDDGVVLLREARCLGCRYCQMACPYGAIRWHPDRRVVSKCTFCAERLERGREPACVETCFAGALRQCVVETEEEHGGCEREAPGFVHLEKVRPSIRFLHAGTANRLPRVRPFPPPVTEET